MNSHFRAIICLSRDLWNGALLRQDMVVSQEVV